MLMIVIVDMWLNISKISEEILLLLFWLPGDVIGPEVGPERKWKGLVYQPCLATASSNKCNKKKNEQAINVNGCVYVTNAVSLTTSIMPASVVVFKLHSHSNLFTFLQRTCSVWKLTACTTISNASATALIAVAPWRKWTFSLSRLRGPSVWSSVVSWRCC